MKLRLSRNHSLISHKSKIRFIVECLASGHHFINTINNKWSVFGGEPDMNPKSILGFQLRAGYGLQLCQLEAFENFSPNFFIVSNSVDGFRMSASAVRGRIGTSWP
jgi:hypothetical protein